MKGRKRTELVQSTSDRKKTRINRTTLCDSPPIVACSSQKKIRRMEATRPTLSNTLMHRALERRSSPRYHLVRQTSRWAFS